MGLISLSTRIELMKNDKKQSLSNIKLMSGDFLGS